MEELHYLDATRALELFRARELSPVELMTAVIERIEQVNDPINALCQKRFDLALRSARDAELLYRDGSEPPPLLGLPVATKEKHAIEGETLSQGLVAQRHVRAAASQTIIRRIQQAGGIIHARTTTPEFSCATVTHSPLWGVTRNPWNLECSPGGSSGGSGAALAAGMTTLATASDIAGSTRIPAAFTGTGGFKAPYGRIPGAPPLSMDHYRSDGPIARTVADAALLANVMIGRDDADHTSLDPAIRIAVPSPDAAADVHGMRIALCIRLGDYVVDPEVEAHTRAVAGVLQDADAVVEEVELPWSRQEITETIFAHFGHLLGPAMADATSGSPELLAAYTRKFMADAKATASRNRHLDGVTVEARMQCELASAMAGFDALLCPTSAVQALRADGDYLDGIDVNGVHLDHYWEGHMTAPFNIANRCPVLAVPGGVGSSGVPTGVQIVGHPFDDLTVFRIGAAIEQLRPWAGRRPEVVTPTVPARAASPSGAGGRHTRSRSPGPTQPR